MSAGIHIPRRSVMKYVPNKHRYWRIRSTKIQGNHASDNFGLTEVEMRAISGGADQCSGGTALSSSDFDGTVPKTNAFDNNTATIWSSVTGLSGGHWIGYDFGVAVNVNEIFITSRTDYLNSNVLSAVIESSDNGSAWTTQWALTEMANWTAGETRTFTRPAFADVRTKWRLLFTQNFISGNAFASFAELVIAATVGGANLATSSTIATDTDFDGTHTKTNLVDGNVNTFWTSGSTATFPHWITFTAASDMSLLQYIMTARNDGTAYQLQPSLIMLQHSLDGKTWHDLKLSGFPTVTSGQVQDFEYGAPGGLAYIAA